MPPGPPYQFLLLLMDAIVVLRMHQIARIKPCT
jgi:hypothetical protein